MSPPECTEPIDREKAKAALANAYSAMGKRTPKLKFCSSPQDALSKIASSVPNEQSEGTPINQISWQKWLLLAAKITLTSVKMFCEEQNQPLNKLSKDLSHGTHGFLDRKIASFIPQGSQAEEIVEDIEQAVRAYKGKTVNEKLPGFPYDSMLKPEAVLKILTNTYLPNEARAELYEKHWTTSDGEIHRALSESGMDWLLLSIPQFHSQSRACTASWLDFCFNTLNLKYNQQKWTAFQSLVRECGWILTHEKTCFVCARPIKLTFDVENRLCNNGEAAIQFADGFEVWIDRNAGSIKT